MARTGLGRGLDVLLGQTSPTIQLAAATEIPLERIVPNRQQPRTSFPAESIAELEDQIQAYVAGEPMRASVYAHQIAFNAHGWSPVPSESTDRDRYARNLERAWNGRSRRCFSDAAPLGRQASSPPPHYPA